MCPKKAKRLTATQMMDALCGLWILYRTGVLDKLLKERAKDVEKGSDKNMSTTAPTVRKKSKEKSVLKERSEKQ